MSPEQMTPERYARIQELFQAVFDLDPAARRSHLDHHVGEDPDLRTEVEALLAQHDTPTAFLEEPPRPRPPMQEGEAAWQIKPGDRIDHYVVRRILGEGGFGLVCEAEQTRPVRRRVALKILKAGMDTGQIIARFEAERQALATMDHPYIAKVLDAGGTESGRPYFVMDYVAGVPITEYCDDWRLSTRERLGLFVKVCEAIQHAHQKGIIHRDIKPSNVLVTIRGDKPVPKVIDFGIAKAVDPRSSGGTRFTAQGQLVGTPPYMSPEQAIGSLDIDTRSDIYSLGALLYEMLAGAPPLDPEALRGASYADVQRMICEQEPPKPSTRVTTIVELDNEDAPVLDENTRRTRRRELRGDLDWIALKALEKDRVRRYAAASELAADVRSHLEHQPVVAGPPGRLYWLSKFVRRNRAVVAATLLMTITLASGLGVILWQKAEARNQADITMSVLFFLNEVFMSQEAGGDPRSTDPEILDRVAHKLEHEGAFADRPDIRAKLHGTIAATYRVMGHHQEAKRHFSHALRLREELLSEDHPNTLITMNNLAGVLLQEGDADRAETISRRALTISRAALGQDSRIAQRAIGYHAHALRKGGKLEEADAVYEEAVAIAESTRGRDYFRAARLRAQWGECLAQLGRYADAEALLKAALNNLQTVLGPDHPDVSRTRAALERLYEAWNKADQASR